MKSFSYLLVSIVILTVVSAAEKDKSKSSKTEKEKAVNKNQTITDEVFLDVEIKDPEGVIEDTTGRIIIGVFGDVCPMTALNFVSLAKGIKRGNSDISYKNCPIHRIVKDFVIQMGDVTVGDGTGSTSIYGDKFNDENFILSHKAAGYVSMANHGKDSNGSQFFILLNKARWLDGKHVVFGKVIKGMDLVRKIGELPSNPNTAVPNVSVRILKSGVRKIEKKYQLTDDQAISDIDI